MGKRGNLNGQMSKEDYDARSDDVSDEPKGPFQKASGDVMKKRRIIRAARGKSPAIASNSTSNPIAPASSNAFSSVKLASSSSGGGGGGAFAGFSFGAPSPAATATAPAAAAAPSLSSSYPSFAMPVIKAIAPTTTTPTTTASKNDDSTATTTAADKERIKCAESFRKHILNVNQLDLAAMGRFISAYGAISDDGNSNNNNKITTSSATTTTETKTWDPNRPLFPTNPSKLVSTTKMSPAAPLFGGVGKAVVPSFSPTAPSPTAGGFSFSLPKTTAAASPAVPAFSFSTVPTPEVKAAAAATTATSSAKGEDDNDDNDNEETTVLEAADDDYKNIVQCNTKVLQVKANQYIARGKLKLEQHKESKKYRLVVRDKTVGRVQFNTAINHGMPLIKETVPPNSKKAGSKPTHVVVITAVLTVGDKPELFKIITTMEDQESLYNALNKIVA